MYEARLVKKWAVMESMLFQAASFLNEPELFSLRKQDLGEYRFNLRQDELKGAMLSLELLAKNNGCKSGFWRRLKKAAVHIEDRAKETEYENEFQEALYRNV